jgi:hypothetical protein
VLWSKVIFPMAGMLQGRKVSFSMARICCGQKLFSPWLECCKVEK